MSQVCLAPVGPDAWPSEGLLSPEVALRTTVGPPRHGTAPAAGRATSGVVVNGRPRRLVLIQVRAALAHLRLLGGALNLGPVVEVRLDEGVAVAKTPSMGFAAPDPDPGFVDGSIL